MHENLETDNPNICGSPSSYIPPLDPPPPYQQPTLSSTLCRPPLYLETLFSPPPYSHSLGPTSVHVRPPYLSSFCPPPLPLSEHPPPYTSFTYLDPHQEICFWTVDPFHSVTSHHQEASVSSPELSPSVLNVETTEGRREGQPWRRESDCMIRNNVRLTDAVPTSKVITWMIYMNLLSLMMGILFALSVCAVVPSVLLHNTTYSDSFPDIGSLNFP
ncbi:hypothetical protein FKM82_013153 [Ascaphus truei]